MLLIRNSLPVGVVAPIDQGDNEVVFVSLGAAELGLIEGPGGCVRSQGQFAADGVGGGFSRGVSITDDDFLNTGRIAGARVHHLPAAAN